MQHQLIKCSAPRRCLFYDNDNPKHFRLCIERWFSDYWVMLGNWNLGHFIHKCISRHAFSTRKCYLLISFHIFLQFILYIHISCPDLLLLGIKIMSADVHNPYPKLRSTFSHVWLAFVIGIQILHAFMGLGEPVHWPSDVCYNIGCVVTTSRLWICACCFISPFWS